MDARGEAILSRRLFHAAEPNPRLRDGLVQGFGSNARVKVHAVGAGAAGGSFPFMLHERNDSGSFAPTPEQADAKGFPQVDIPVMRVDTLLANSDRPPADMLKIDAEGLDLEVIEGARKTIAGSRSSSSRRGS